MISPDHRARTSGPEWAAPRAAQHRNVLVALYRIPPADPFPFSHAYFPSTAFDEVIERSGWTFARLADAYLAPHSQRPAHFTTTGPYADQELRVDAPENAWLCELGNAACWGTFGAFVDAIVASAIAHDGLAVRYESPSIGSVEFGWHDPLKVAGQEIPLRGYARLDTPYGHAKFGATQLPIHLGDHAMVIDFLAGREA